MMSDLVKRLRGHTWADADFELYGEAAELIEQLEKVIEALMEAVDDCKHNHIMLTGDEFSEFLDTLDSVHIVDVLKQTQATQDTSTSNKLSKTRGVKP